MVPGQEGLVPLHIATLLAYRLINTIEMKKYTVPVFYGLLTWAVPFIVSFFFFNRQGELTVNEFLFKSIMIIVGSGVACVILVHYFKTVQENFIKAGITIGIIWLVINWLMDFVILIPISGMSFSEYIIEIGLRYLVIPIMSTSIGVALDQKSS